MLLLGVPGVCAGFPRRMGWPCAVLPPAPSYKPIPQNPGALWGSLMGRIVLSPVLGCLEGSQQHLQGKLVPVNIPVRMPLLQHPAPLLDFAPRPPSLGWGRGPRLWSIWWGRTLVGLRAGSGILCVFIILSSEEAGREEKISLCPKSLILPNNESCHQPCLARK